MNAGTGFFETPTGLVALSWDCGMLTRIDLDPDDAAVAPDDPPSVIRAQLAAYFEHGEVGFDLPLALRGTDFQLRVWRALQAIPPGTTVTYGELAETLGSGARAVGGACRANPCPIVVPCHRVVAKHGLGGFAGDTSGRKLSVKRWLLDHERVAVCRKD